MRSRGQCKSCVRLRGSCASACACPVTVAAARHVSACLCFSQCLRLTGAETAELNRAGQPHVHYIALLALHCESPFRPHSSHPFAVDRNLIAELQIKLFAKFKAAEVVTPTTIVTPSKDVHTYDIKAMATLGEDRCGCL